MHKAIEEANIAFLMIALEVKLIIFTTIPINLYRTETLAAAVVPLRRNDSTYIDKSRFL